MDEKELARNVSNSLNCFGFDNRAFCEQMKQEHKTLQQNFTRLCVAWFETLAKMEPWEYDGRNENSVKMAKQIIESLDGRMSLPFI